MILTDYPNDVVWVEWGGFGKSVLRAAGTFFDLARLDYSLNCATFMDPKYEWVAINGISYFGISGPITLLYIT